MPSEDKPRPATLADLRAFEENLTSVMAEANKGLVLAMSAVCITLVNTGAVTGDALIAHLRLTTETMMRGQEPSATQDAVDQIVFALQQLGVAGTRTDAAH